MYIHSSAFFAAGFPLPFILLNLRGTFYSFFCSFLPLKHLSQAHWGLVHPSSEVHFTGSYTPTPGEPLPRAGSAGAARGSRLRVCPTRLRRRAHLPSAHGYPRSSCIPTVQGYHELPTLSIKGLEGEMLIVFRSLSSPSWLTFHMEEVYVKLMFTSSAICNIILHQTILVNTYSLFLCWTLGENCWSSCFNVPSSIIYNILSYKWQLTKTQLQFLVDLLMFCILWAWSFLFLKHRMLSLTASKCN